jgi:transcriptional regulator with XRE-family HTH domain
MLPDVIRDEWATVRKALRELIDAKGWSQTKAAKELGVSQSAVSQFIADDPRWKPSVALLAGLARVLQRPMEELLPPRLRNPKSRGSTGLPQPAPTAQFDDAVARLRQLAADIYIALDRAEADVRSESRDATGDSPKRSRGDRGSD